MPSEPTPTQRAEKLMAQAMTTVGFRPGPDEERSARLGLAAVPGDLLVDLAIERGALEQVGWDHELPQDPASSHRTIRVDRVDDYHRTPLYRRSVGQEQP